MKKKKKYWQKIKEWRKVIGKYRKKNNGTEREEKESKKIIHMRNGKRAFVWKKIKEKPQKLEAYSEKK